MITVIRGTTTTVHHAWDLYCYDPPRPCDGPGPHVGGETSQIWALRVVWDDGREESLGSYADYDAMQQRAWAYCQALEPDAWRNCSGGILHWYSRVNGVMLLGERHPSPAVGHTQLLGRQGEATRLCAACWRALWEKAG